jgi:hypothetical protein
VRVIPQHLEETFALLKPYFGAIELQAAEDAAPTASGLATTKKPNCRRRTVRGARRA